jgi:two-component system CheB/CheR fusion protein
VVVNDRLDILQFRGRTGPWLEPPQGEPQSQLLKMARPGLVGPLRVALALARKGQAVVRRERVAVDGPGGSRACDLVVLPLRASLGGEPAFVVLFEDRPPARAEAAAGRGKGKRPRLAAVARGVLEEELASTKEHLAALLEEHGRGNDALASANDELTSANEELQSLNEELETAKEEVQASNEELTTVNEELNGRNQELQLVNADVLNLLDAVELPILMLDEGRRLRRFTRKAATFLGLAPTDVERDTFADTLSRSICLIPTLTTYDDGSVVGILPEGHGLGSGTTPSRSYFKLGESSRCIGCTVAASCSCVCAEIGSLLM